MSPYGLLDLPLWQVLIIALAATHLTIVSVTIFLHRSQAHRALDLHPAVMHFFRFWLWLTTGMVTKEWVAVHRKHHGHCETTLDPHSPQILGIGRVFWQGVELYRAAAQNRADVERYGIGTPDDWLERNLYSRWSWQGCGLLLIVDLALFGVYGLTLWAVQMLWIPVLAAGVINGIGHYWGYRNFESPDASTNIVPWGILIGGEELHNNHHAFPSSARLSVRWWELDLGWLYIRLLSALGLARVKKLAPQPRVIAGKASVDLETLKAVIVGRMHVIRRFSAEVLHPVTRQELCRSDRHCRLLARRVSRLLARESSRLDAKGRMRLEEVLAQSRQLQIVYQYREGLRRIWERRAPSQEDLLHLLQEWCQQAEKTGIQALEHFARNLRGLSLIAPPARS
jgi:stearoyl-CoA desaturase (delta-9 desaturase)